MVGSTSEACMHACIYAVVATLYTLLVPATTVMKIDELTYNYGYTLT